MTQFSSLKLRIVWGPLRTECLAWFPLCVFITQTQFGLSESDENWKQGFAVFCFSNTNSNSIAISVKWKTSWSPQLVYCHVSLILPLQICPFLFLTTTTTNPAPIHTTETPTHQPSADPQQTDSSHAVTHNPISTLTQPQKPDLKPDLHRETQPTPKYRLKRGETEKTKKETEKSGKIW